MTDTPKPATALPWKVYTEHQGLGEVWDEARTQMVAHAQVVKDGRFHDHEARQQNAEYIAYAANTLPTLQAEVERLREALRPFAEIASLPEAQSQKVIYVPIMVSHAEAARAALHTEGSE